MSLVKTTSNGNVIAKRLELLAHQIGKDKPKQVRVAASRAINKATDTIISRTKKAVGKRSRVPASVISRRMKIPRKGRANTKFLYSKIHIYKAGIPLYALAKNSKGGVVKSRINMVGRKGSRAITIGTDTGRHRVERGFVNVVGRKRTPHILARKGKGRYPIELPKIFIHDDLNKHAQKRIRRTFRIIYDREMERVLKLPLTEKR
jgi:Prophage minor tail protein Z (GPZ)